MDTRNIRDAVNPYANTSSSCSWSSPLASGVGSADGMGSPSADVSGPWSLYSVMIGARHDPMLYRVWTVCVKDTRDLVTPW